ncbi:hypothetical protein CN613_13360 [Bacillus pseudomycoides]|uniref:Uncharacterized protein n=1 Tax=Bacillus pseudomycoides TaxID=64104 RepID=A0A2B6RWX4_9BACI|nr:hypothetical protein CON79_20655 [Bacillus pseudomycoides]PEA82409.1 hypothetical protein CON99_17290 [Bacillus pseudomycoides]PEM68907.1 hypothetical protein CN613_13360 [Bacillus pseudomycoides]PGC42526.1 hypothetical protein COM14_26420 [Bacillus pseudomycoides]PGD33448.1 hypothetical protein COM30_12770 [Bacillus pseudomycoides]
MTSPSIRNHNSYIFFLFKKKLSTYPQIGGTMMKHLIVYAHPNPQSFNHAILETVKSELEEVKEVVNRLLG